ncbi:MAG: hypothetical protein B9S33_15945 [Pedosphaera sp. Tous-C6FEB]|nr:MAG: hypothetical protein B9S33_15945 [Pedosphaera sp. Tous-C6FEB]
MVQLRVLNGGRAGAVHIASQFPCTIGRAANDSLRLNEPGVWDHHLQLELEVPTGFRLRRLGQGRASVNEQEFNDVVLRNGDVIALGAAKLQFWLGEVKQGNNRLRELITWLAIGLAVILQGILVSLLL